MARLLLEEKDTLRSKLKYHGFGFSIAGHLLTLAFAFFENLCHEPLADVLGSFNDHQLAQTTDDLFRLVADLHTFDTQSSTFRPVAGVNDIR